MKKKIKIILIIILVLIIFLFLVALPTILNSNYYKNTISLLETKTDNKITYLNEYNNYYIIKTKENIIVYDKKYQEIYRESLDKISNMNYDIIYKKDTLMYEKTTLSKHKVTYTYYDIYTKEKIDSLEIEG